MKYHYTLPLIVGGLAGAYLCGIAAWLNAWSMPLLLTSGFFLCVALVRIFIFTYQMWRAIDDGQTRMSPLQAVLFNCIPGFNIIWLYQCIWGFAHDCNAYVKRHAIQTPELQSHIFFWYVTAWLISPIPYLGLVSIPVAIILVSLLLQQTIRTLRIIEA